MNWHAEQPSTSVIALLLVRHGCVLSVYPDLCRWNTSLKRWLGVTSGLVVRSELVAWTHEADILFSFLESGNAPSA